MIYLLILIASLSIVVICAIIVLGVINSFKSNLSDLGDSDAWDEILFYAIVAVDGAILLSFFNLGLIDTPVSVNFNVTGSLIPAVIFILVLISRQVKPSLAIVSVLIVTTVGYPLTSLTSGGITISFPLWLIPAGVASVSAVILTTRISRWTGCSPAATAYISGCMGMLLGGDLLHLPDIVSKGVSIFSIGAGGITDFVFLTGVVAVPFVWAINAVMSYKGRIVELARMVVQ